MTEILMRAKGDMRLKIITEQETNEERLKQDVDKLQEWLQKQPHLPQNLGVELLECFSVGCKGIEDAKTRLDRYFTVRNYIKEFYIDRDPLKLQKPDVVEQYFLPGYTKSGQTVFVIRVPKNASTKHFNDLTVMKRHTMLIDYMFEQGCISSGVIMIYDLAGVSASFLQNFNISLFSRSNKAFQDNYPLQMKKLFFINCGSFVVNVYENIIRPLVKKKFVSRVNILKAGDFDTLKKHIPEDILPLEMGGRGLPSKQLHDSYIKLLEDNREWCLASEKIKSDESKRIYTSKFDFQEQFGVDGNFRQLSLD